MYMYMYNYIHGTFSVAEVAGTECEDMSTEDSSESVGVLDRLLLRKRLEVESRLASCNCSF